MRNCIPSPTLPSIDFASVLVHGEYQPTEQDWAEYTAFQADLDSDLDSHFEPPAPKLTDSEYLLLVHHRHVAWQEEFDPADLALTTVPSLGYRDEADAELSDDRNGFFGLSDEIGGAN